MTAFDARGRTDQGFADALCGPDGTSDPSVLMPVLQVYPDALSAPMPDAMVARPPLDGAAAPTVARPPIGSPPAPPPRPTAARVVQPGRPGGNASTSRPAQWAPRSTPAAWGPIEPQRPAAPHRPVPRPAGPPLRPTPASSSPWSGQVMSPGEVAGFLRNTLSGLTHGPGSNPAPPHQPVAHAPSPPLPRNLARRNKGSGVWAVFIFLVVIAFASGLGQQVIRAISELFGR